MTRLLVCVVALLVVGGAFLLPPAATADGDGQGAGAAKPKPPQLASDEQAADALKIFKVNWKASGLKGDDKVMQRDWALRQIAPLQHPDIVDAIGKVTRNPHPDLRMLAMIYLADQTLHPHQAGKHVLQAMRKHKKDVTLLMTGLQTLGSLKYLGARKEITDLLKHKHFVIRKTAITAVGDIGDLRMLEDMLKMLGLKVEAQSGSGDTGEGGGGAEQTEDGYSWDGVDVTYDTGTAGDHDQKMAEKIGKEQLAKNKAEAAGGAGGPSKGGGGGSSGGGGGRGATSRTPEELVPTILRSLKKLTGEEFDKPSTIRKWLRENKEKLAEQEKALDAEEKAQKKA